MNQAPALEHAVQAAERVLPFERVVLVLQGGGALGAYQGGVYQAIAEANIPVTWVCGTSIGGINGALLAGNRPERRVERLREFWEAVTEPPIRLPNIPWFSELPWNDNDHTRYWTNRMSAFSTMFHGAPNFFTPRPFPPISSAAEHPDQVSYYDTTPLRATLGRLVDFDLINEKPLRFSVAATNVRTGAPVYFDNLKQTLTAAHVMASASLPPGFPPTEIDGEYYWDGGVVSNSPMQLVIDDRPRYTALVFQVDLWDANGEVPLDIPSANLRALEIHSASRLNVTLEQYRKTQNSATRWQNFSRTFRSPVRTTRTFSSSARRRASRSRPSCSSNTRRTATKRPARPLSSPEPPCRSTGRRAMTIPSARSPNPACSNCRTFRKRRASSTCIAAG